LQRKALVVDSMDTNDPSDDVVLDAEFLSHGHFPDGDFCADVRTLTA
jgi:hypothetical protein